MPRRFGIAPRVAAGVLLAALLLPAQSKRPEDLAAGKLLVTPRDAADPHFAEAVILLVHYDADSAVGLILNRRTTVSLARVLQNLKGAAQRSDTAYIGGPVGTDTAMALVRSRGKPEAGVAVLKDTYLIPSQKALEGVLAAGADAADLRVYAGYCGWGPGQLVNEVRLGAWHLMAGSSGTVFDPNPDTVWSRLIAHTESRVALALRPRGLASGFQREIR
jgi:putative transcriptional regulator